MNATRCNLIQSRRRLWHVTVLFVVGAAICIQIRSVYQTTGSATSRSSILPFSSTLIESCPRKQQKRHPICASLPNAASASSIWQNRLEEILNASIHPEDTSRYHEPWIRTLLFDLFHPHLLQQGLRVVPHLEPLQPLVTKILLRIEDPSSNPPLKILVFGGSTAEGTGCHRWFKELFGNNTKRSYSSKLKGTAGKGRACAWPFRLQVLLDRFVGNDVIQVNNLAVGATHSGLAGPFLQYWLYPPYFRPNGPDVVLNAFMANDNVPAAKWYPDGNTSADPRKHVYQVLSRNLEFVDRARQSRPMCSNLPVPVIFYIDEYLGNLQDSILGDGEASIWLQWLASVRNVRQGGIGYISTAKVVRPLVLASSIKERVLSPQWMQVKTNATIRNVHLSMSGHVYIAWVIAYSFLQLFVDFCQDQGQYDLDHTIPAWMKKPSNAHERQSSSSLSVMGGLRNFDLISFLSSLLSLDMGPAQHNIPRQSQNSNSAICTNWSSSDESSVPPCIFAFLAAPLGTHSNPTDLNSYLKRVTVENTGWSAQVDMKDGGYQYKLGLVAQNANASLMLALRNIATPVRVITIHTLKSYGEKWWMSRARFTLEVFYQRQLRYQNHFEIDGYHNQSFSLSEPFVLRLDNNVTALEHSSIRFTIRLIGGTTFKINTLLFCSR